MGPYKQLGEKRAEAHYRAGDIDHSVEGTLVADSANSLSIEERYTQGGRDKNMRFEIPYEYIIRVTEIREKPRVENPIPPASPSSPERKRG